MSTGARGAGGAPTTGRGGRRWPTAIALLAALASGGGASAYDPATTHAGLTQQASVASALHQVLVRRLGRAQGLFDQVALHAELLPEAERRLLLARLGALDPAGGYRPGADAVASALAWTVAGSVLAKTPPERIQNLYLDPSTGSGLRDAAALDGFAHAIRMIFDAGGSLRGVATGSSFSFEGEPSTRWIESPDNELGLVPFIAQLERAIAETEPAARSSALARALLAMGGVLCALEDAGNPAQVRNDFRASYLHGNVGSPFDRTSSYEELVAELYGVAGVPAARSAVRRPNVRAYFTAADGQGLADRTQRRFFSEGTLPADGIVDRDTTPREVVMAARGSLTYALPSVPRLELRELGVRRYAMVTDEGGTRRLLGYERVPGRVRFFLDRNVYADSARALLPEVASYAAGLIDHLMRGEITLSRDGDRVRAVVSATAGRIHGGPLRLLAEDAAGRRHEIASFKTDGGAPDDVSAQLPPGTRRVAAVLRGEDTAGPVVAFGEMTIAEGASPLPRALPR